MSATLKTVYALIMLFAVFVVIGGKFPAFGRMFVASEPVAYALGDQYRMCELDRFREEIPVVESAPNPPLDETEIIALGDSFFNSALGSEFFANELSRKIGLKVHNMHTSEFFEPQSYPLSYLEKIGYKGGRRRILVLESVERSVLERAGKYNTLGVSTSNKLDAFAFKVLKNSDVEYFFKHNLIVEPLGKRLKNFRFERLGIVDKSIGAYSVDPKMLFYQRDIQFGRTKKTEAMLDNTADSIAALSASLKKRHDIDLVYLVIPDKYSVYRALAPNAEGYDRFIPRLCAELTERGVKNLDVYSLYARYSKPGMPPIYYSSDTHYTALGKSILAGAAAELIKGLDATAGPTGRQAAAGSGMRR